MNWSINMLGPISLIFILALKQMCNFSKYNFICWCYSLQMKYFCVKLAQNNHYLVSTVGMDGLAL